MTIQDLPAVNASLNGLATLFIVIGLATIQRDRKQAHIVSMTAALVTSVAFLACYVAYHIGKGGVVTRFTHDGWPRVLYFAILISHTILATVTPVLVALTVIPALRARYDRHRRLARWTWPIWLYVSITGVLVYFMLYVWFPPRA